MSVLVRWVGSNCVPAVCHVKARALKFMKGCDLGEIVNWAYAPMPRIDLSRSCLIVPWVENISRISLHNFFKWVIACSSVLEIKILHESWYTNEKFCFCCKSKI